MLETPLDSTRVIKVLQGKNTDGCKIKKQYPVKAILN